LKERVAGPEAGKKGVDQSLVGSSRQALQPVFTAVVPFELKLLAG
jgi:hypothetical protein